jgi:polysaccharide export outer membrane protein
MMIVRSTTFTKPSLPGVLMTLALMLTMMAGCQEVEDFFKTDQSRLLNPGAVIDSRYATGRPIKPIIPEIGPADAKPELLPNSTEPTPQDLVYYATDYVIGPTDVLDISILDLFAQGRETVVRRQVASSGYISLPELPKRVKAEDLTAEELKEEIKRAYKRSEILRDPTVSVTIVMQRNATFSILGAVAGPGRYAITRRDMRLLDAIAAAGGVAESPAITHLYVIRPSPAIRRKGQGESAGASGGTGPLDALPALPDASTAAKAGVQQTPATGQGNGKVSPEDVQDIMSTTRPSTPKPTAARQYADAGQPARTLELRNGKYVPASQPDGQASTAPAGASGSDPFGWTHTSEGDQTRIIAVNLSKLLSGDHSMNIIVRDNDIIRVPQVEAGEYYIMGEVSRPGAYTLTGRKITVKQAVAAAGNLGQLSWPENSLLIRRLEGNQEQTIPLDIEAIFKGEQNEIYLRPNDVIAVGTDVRAPFWAVIRNAFRLTYGFGFVYDRNFGDPAPGEAHLTSHRFSRW